MEFRNPEMTFRNVEAAGSYRDRNYRSGYSLQIPQWCPRDEDTSSHAKWELALRRHPVNWISFNSLEDYSPGVQMWKARARMTQIENPCDLVFDNYPITHINFIICVRQFYFFHGRCLYDSFLSFSSGRVTDTIIKRSRSIIADP
jgi:hypothetical protein